MAKGAPLRWAPLAVALALLARTATAARLRSSNATLSTRRSLGYEVRLENYRNVQYSGEFLAGGQELPVIYDTGSFEVILLSKLCTQGCSSMLASYDETGSPSFSSSGVYGEHHFGSGSVYSKKGFETLSIGTQGSPLVAHHMQFWQVVRNRIAVWNDRAVFSGIVGLSHTDSIPEGYSVDGYSETLLHSMRVDRFSICLERSGPSAPGWLSAGAGLDMLPSVFQTVPMVGKVHWAVRMTNVYADGSGAYSLCQDSCGAIIDSGTSLIAAPSSAQPLIDKLQGMVRADCSNLSDLPVLRLSLGGVAVELPPKAYVMRVRKSSSWYGEPEMECRAAFMTINKHSELGPVWILGMPFLRYYHTVFDRSGKQIHIAPSTPDCQAPGGQIFAASAGPGANGSVHLAVANSSGAARLGSGMRTRAFAPADYAPAKLDVPEFDVNATRLPSWASGVAEELLHV